MRKWSKAPRILSLFAVMIAAVVGFAPAAYAAEGDVMIGDNAYASVPEAVQAIVDTKELQGSTIKLTKDLTGPGVVVAEGQKFTFDLDGHTYTVTDPMVGSTGTETNAFQLLAGSDLTFKNGVITTESKNAAILIQNYCNLKLEKVTLKGGPSTMYTLSNNSGSVNIGTGTNIYAGEAGPRVAFDVCRFASYSSPQVSVATDAGEIVGKIELSVSGDVSGNKPVLKLEGGNLEQAVLSPAGDAAKVVKVEVAQGVSIALSENHEWGIGGEIVRIAARVVKGDEVKTYKTLSEAIENADGATIKLLDNVTESVVIPEGKTILLDLAGHKITNETGKHTITNKGALTVVDSVGGGVVDNVSHARGALVNEGTAIIESGKFTRSKEAGSSATENGGNSWYVIDNNGGDLTFTGGEVVSTGKYSSLLRNINATLAIKGGKFSNEFIAIKNDDDGKLDISGGVITSPEQAVQNWSDAKISGGTFEGNVYSWSYEGGSSNLVVSGTASIKGNLVAVNYDGSANKPTVTVNGGAVSGDIFKGEYKQGDGVQRVDSSADSSAILVTGGSFESSSVEDFVAPGSGLNKNPDGSFDVHQHALVAVVELPATCEADGRKAHWKCETCGALYLDKDMKDEVTDPNTLVLAKRGHEPAHVPAKDATVDAEGVVEHWYCSRCDTYFADANLTKTMTKAETVVAKLPKEFTVTFESGAGKPTSVTAHDGALLEEPAAPALKGWKFLGWYKVKNADGTVAEKWDFAKDAVTADITLYGGWVKADVDKTDASPTNKLPKTGDTTILPMMAAGISGAVALVIASKRRQR